MILSEISLYYETLMTPISGKNVTIYESLKTIIQYQQNQDIENNKSTESIDVI